MARKVEFTARDYDQIPEDWHMELIGGDLVMVPAPDPSHERLAAELMFLLADHLGTNERHRVLGSRIDIRIDDKNIVQPDVVVLPEGTQPTPLPWKIPTPVWVAEVLSPGTIQRDRGIKLRLYGRKGIREAWIVDPRRKTIEVHDLRSGAHAKHGEGAAVSAASPGFEIDVARFFAP